MKRVYVIHGYESSPRKNWFVWLKKFVFDAKIGHVHLLEMPAAEQPDISLWLSFLRENVLPLDQNTFIVAHSLGCIASLQFLQEKDFDIFGGVILVSGFYERISGLEVLDPFVQVPLAFDKLCRRISKRCVLTARDDVIVPYSYTQRLAEKLEADFFLLHKGNHFMDSDGFDTFPLVGFLLKEMVE